MLFTEQVTAHRYELYKYTYARPHISSWVNQILSEYHLNAQTWKCNCKMLHVNSTASMNDVIFACHCFVLRSPCEMGCYCVWACLYVSNISIFHSESSSLLLPSIRPAPSTMRHFLVRLALSAVIVASRYVHWSFLQTLTRVLKLALSIWNAWKRLATVVVRSFYHKSFSLPLSPFPIALFSHPRRCYSSFAHTFCTLPAPYPNLTLHSHIGNVYSMLCKQFFSCKFFRDEYYSTKLDNRFTRNIECSQTLHIHKQVRRMPSAVHMWTKYPITGSCAAVRGFCPRL